MHTEFVIVSALLDTSMLPVESLKYLELLMECLFELPIEKEDGVILTHEDVVAGLNRDTLSQINSLGALCVDYN